MALAHDQASERKESALRWRAWIHSTWMRIALQRARSVAAALGVAALTVTAVDIEITRSATVEGNLSTWMVAHPVPGISAKQADDDKPTWWQDVWWSFTGGMTKELGKQFGLYIWYQIEPAIDAAYLNPPATLVTKEPDAGGLYRHVTTTLEKGFARALGVNAQLARFGFSRPLKMIGGAACENDCPFRFDTAFDGQTLRVNYEAGKGAYGRIEGETRERGTRIYVHVTDHSPGNPTLHYRGVLGSNRTELLKDPWVQ